MRDLEDWNNARKANFALQHNLRKILGEYHPSEVIQLCSTFLELRLGDILLKFFLKCAIWKILPKKNTRENEEKNARAKREANTAFYFWLIISITVISLKLN